MVRVAQSAYSRTVWAIMTKFNVLPTNPDFKALTTEQMDWIIASMNEDVRQLDAAARGVTLEGSYTDDDNYMDNVYNNPSSNFSLVKEGHDPEEIYRQVQAITKDKELDARIDRKIANIRDHGADYKARERELTAMQVEENTKALLKKAKQKGLDTSFFDDDDYGLL